MRETPIIFSGPMVRAIIEGRKTQTRRIIKHPEYFGCLTGDCPHSLQFECDQDINKRFVPDCPYGIPGDRLWVRETHMVWTGGAAGTTDLLYADDPEWDAALKDRDEIRKAHSRGQMNPGVCGNYKIIPSIHMPRWASRITLEITEVRVQRLQDITEEDAKAEGCSESEPITQADIDELQGQEKELARLLGEGQFTAKFDFMMLWDQIYGKRVPWASTPWVWVISFRRVEVSA